MSGQTKKLQQKQLAKAIQIAATAHVGHFDKGDNAYILHPLSVMNGLESKDPEVMQIAVLHDVIEDCPEWTLDRLRGEGFSNRVLIGLSFMSKTEEDLKAGDEGYYAYIRRMFQNIDAVLVKMSDIRDNSQVTRLKGLREKDQKRMVKYARAYTMLEEHLESVRASCLTGNHKV
jgi:(p)ppGpp synthase/HD superfamily hydrolase